jgi:DNA-binding NtrC family response regulator
MKLLRFLETRSVERLGSHRPIALDLRLVCATNRDLAQMVKEGKFREDLYYRLSVVPLRLPPLRERPDDIPLLLVHYLERFAKENGSAPAKLSPEAQAVLTRYAWPGNIRELRNACENLAVLRAGRVVAPADLDPRFALAAPPAALPLAGPNALDREQNEKQLLRQALAAAGGNRTRAAELMGISRRTLHRKLLQWPELDPGPETA